MWVVRWARRILSCISLFLFFRVFFVPAAAAAGGLGIVVFVAVGGIVGWSLEGSAGIGAVVDVVGARGAVWVFYYGWRVLLDSAFRCAGWFANRGRPYSSGVYIGVGS